MSAVVETGLTEQLVEASQITIAVIGALSCALAARVLRRSHLSRWALAWCSLVGALLALRVATATASRPWWAAYLVAEWLYLLLLVTGCLELLALPFARGRLLLLGLPFAVGAAIVFVQVPTTFNGLFAIQSAVLAAGYFYIRLQLGRLPAERRGTGWKVMAVAVTLLAVLFAVYVPCFVSIEWGASLPLFSDSSLADAAAQAILIVGMLWWSIETVRDADDPTPAETPH